MRGLGAATICACLAIRAISAQSPPPGPVVDPSAFTYSRTIAAGPAALVVLPLDVAVLAHSRGPRRRFADLRIVDATNQQIPYLLEQGSEPLELALPLGPSSAAPPGRASTDGPHRSTYRVMLPYPHLPEADLVIETSAQTFRREVQLWEEGPSDRRRRDPRSALLSTRVWTHTDGSLAAPPLVLSARERETTFLFLTIDEGDNAPLPLTSARLRLPAWRLRFYRPEGTTLRLLYGHREAVAPEYDLALLRTKVMDAPAQDVSAAPEPVMRDRAAIVSPRLFWGFLIAAVVVLGALIARLAISRSSEDQPPPSAPRP